MPRLLEGVPFSRASNPLAEATHGAGRRSVTGTAALRT
ncbi:hypothetical protein F750_0736 [Streptomyces sp. PAMC 26508]|nr:hypothetical protein F750_0736 [Streptomyces sp. PAMC 26508]